MVDAQKVSPGGFAITVFISSAIYLVVGNHGWQTLLTFKAVIFLLPGVFFSVLLVGVPFHLLSVWIDKEFLQNGRGSGFQRKGQADKDVEHSADGGAGCTVHPIRVRMVVRSVTRQTPKPFPVRMVASFSR